ncbi:MAG: hypothetical protein KAT37_03115 [Candidatus Aenigmarchaeota archaeon]|nr:hypothetical protein [Candidatus Aenigmarchaeota archaeon]
MEDVYSKLARYEVEWWKAHHRKDKKALLENMAKLYQLLYKLCYEDAVECVKYRIEAGKEHDIAEKFEDEGNQNEADIHWNKAEELVKKHFKTLMSNLKKQSWCLK